MKQNFTLLSGMQSQQRVENGRCRPVTGTTTGCRLNHATCWMVFCIDNHQQNICSYFQLVVVAITLLLLAVVRPGQVQKAVANPHFKAHLFQDTRQGVHSLCSVNYAPWQ